MLVAPVVNDTGTNFEFDVAEELTGHLKEELKKRQIGLADDEKQPGRIVILEAHLALYAAGNLAGRWIAPGLGAASCVVRIKLVDAISRRLVGDTVAIQYVGGGGLFSIGAEHWILEHVAQDMAQAYADTAEKGQRK